MGSLKFLISLWSFFRRAYSPTFIFVFVLVIFFAGNDRAYPNPALHKVSGDNSTCLSCHPGETINLSAFESSVHKDFACVMCHSAMGTVPHKQPYVKPDCGTCHISAVKNNSKEQKSNRLYTGSIHYAALKGGDKDAATCTSCHGAHEVMPVSSRDSRVNRSQISRTCGQCHARIFEAYKKSIHGKAFESGKSDSAVCTDCHGGHLVLSAQNKDSPTHTLRIAATCSRCHADEKLAKKYGMDITMPRSYMKSYHGVALQFGDVTSATCVSCHGSHDTLPSREPASSTHAANLVKTCGCCHQGIGKNFVKGTVHLWPTPRKDPLIFGIRILYALLIASVIVGLMALIIIDLHGKSIKRHGPDMMEV